jgi:GGDEF domain-containing protein
MPVSEGATDGTTDSELALNAALERELALTSECLQYRKRELRWTISIIVLSGAAFAVAVMGDRPLTLALIDLDHFKKIYEACVGDRKTHRAAPSVLQEALSEEVKELTHAHPRSGR